MEWHPRGPIVKEELLADAVALLTEWHNASPATHAFGDLESLRTRTAVLILIHDKKIVKKGRKGGRS